MEYNSLSPSFIQHRLMHINRLHRAAVHNKVSKTGMHRSQHMLLMYLNRKDFKVSQKDIAEHFEISPAAVAVCLKKLENGGYIKKTTSSEDNRFNEVTITGKGREIVEFSHNAFSDIDNQTLEDISDEEKLQLLCILEKIEANLKALAGKEYTDEKMV